MRYRLRTLVFLTAIGPPVLAWFWLNREWFAVACGWTLIVVFFAFWYWMLHKSQSLAPSTRGQPNYELKHYPPGDT